MKTAGARCVAGDAVITDVGGSLERQVCEESLTRELLLHLDARLKELESKVDSRLSGFQLQLQTYLDERLQVLPSLLVEPPSPTCEPRPGSLSRSSTSGNTLRGRSLSGGNSRSGGARSASVSWSSSAERVDGSELSFKLIAPKPEVLAHGVCPGCSVDPCDELAGQSHCLDMSACTTCTKGSRENCMRTITAVPEVQRCLVDHAGVAGEQLGGVELPRSGVSQACLKSQAGGAPPGMLCELPESAGNLDVQPLALGSRWFSHELAEGKAESRLHKLESSYFASVRAPERMESCVVAVPPILAAFEKAGGPDDGGGATGDVATGSGQPRPEKKDANSSKCFDRDFCQRAAMRDRERQLEEQISSTLATFLPRRAMTPRRPAPTVT